MEGTLEEEDADTVQPGHAPKMIGGSACIRKGARPGPSLCHSHSLHRDCYLCREQKLQIDKFELSTDL